MRAAPAQRVTRVWLGLVVLTCATTWGATEERLAGAVVVATIFLITALKVALVMAEFMELRHGPWPVRALFGTWIVVVTTLILAFWSITPAVA